LATLHEVATRAGVSDATASHVLNGTKRVSQELRERVLIATRELGYEPNGVARSLRIRKSLAVGVVISDISQPAHATAVRAIEETARLRGYTVMVCDTNEDPALEASAIAMLRSRQVDGFIVVPAGPSHPSLASLVESGKPLVFMDRELPELPASSAVLDNALAAKSAVDHLIGHGHERVGFIETKRGISATRERTAGYMQALAEHGLAFDDRLIAWGELTADSGSAAMTSLMRLEAPPTAVFVAGNHVTIGALSALRVAGKVIPDQIAVIGHADSEWWSLATPALTTVYRPWYELGWSAAKLLFERIDQRGANGPTRRVSLACDLVVREYCGSHPEPTGTPVQVASLVGH
jgi:LacI family transcriptional regulator